MPGDHQAILAANRRFYSAFNARSPAAMEEVWAVRVPVQCIHPGWDPILGREAVLESWRRIFAASTGATLTPQEERILTEGASGMALTYELVENQPLIATNLFMQEDGEWRMVHHHAGPCRSAPPAPGTATHPLQ